MGTPRQMLTLDVGRRNACRNTVYLGEGDVNGTMLVVSVTEYGSPFDCEGYTPYLMVPLRDGSVYRKDGTATGNVVSIVVDESGLGNVNGRIPNAYVSLEGEDGTMTSTQRFDVFVVESHREAVAPDSFVTDLESLTTRVAALEKALRDALETEGQTDGTNTGDDEPTTSDEPSTGDEPTTGDEPPTGDEPTTGDDTGDTEGGA